MVKNLVINTTFSFLVFIAIGKLLFDWEQQPKMYLAKGSEDTEPQLNIMSTVMTEYMLMLLYKVTSVCLKILLP